MGRLNSAATQVWLRETDLVDLTLATLPAYLRGEGHPVLADRIEAAGNDRAELLVVLIDGKRQLPEGSEAWEVCRAMAGALGQFPDP